MAHDENFALDLFGATAQSSGLDFGLPANAGGLAHRADTFGPSASLAATVVSRVVV